ncbi:MAG: Uncharacterized protein G01um10147_1168 [Microgenomates group bacterium Gr01-1014_7]|nr:MAG: Uncharacterized protein G01um10147_1168 [Microgenomates group bacterium Gr01-1014_7]
MAYRTRSARRMVRKTRHNFLATIIIILVLLFVTLNWILPALINGIGFVKNFINHPQTQKSSTLENPSLAPPVLNIPFEATNSAQISISGYASPNSKVKLYLDDSSKQTVDVSGDGSFIFSNIHLSLGTNNIYAKTVDEAEKESLSSKLFRIIYDSEKPVLLISEPEDSKKIQGGDKKVKVSGKTELGAKVFINDSQTVVDKDGNFSTDLPINEGDNTITIKAVDVATNTAEIQRKVTYNP